MTEQDREPPYRQTAKPKTAAGGFLPVCCELAGQMLPGQLDELFTRVDEALYDLADKATSNTLYTTYFDAVRLLRRRREAIRGRWLDLLVTVARGPPVAAAEGLRLVGDAELEELLVLSNLVAKAETRYRAELAVLRRRLAARDGGRIEPQTDPLGPQAICDAFRGALASVEELDPAIKLLIYKVFDQEVMDHLGPLYRRCLGLLPMDGVANAPRVGAADLASGRAVPGERPHEPLRHSDVLSMPPGFDGLRGLLRRSPAPGDDRAAVVAQGDVLAMLSHLQGSALGQGDPVEAVAAMRERVRHALRLDGGPHSGRRLDARDEDALDLVFLLFESILAGSDLPDVFKALIGRLQIPVLKIALADPRFFDDTAHPARSLLNHLAEAAEGWSPEGDEASAELHGLIVDIVERILRDFDRDIGLFRLLDARLLAYLEQERRQADAALSQALDGLASREASRGTERAVERVIAARLRQQGPVPEPVATLIENGWRQVLLAAHGRGGEEGDDWQSALVTLDRLLWSVQPKLGQSERRELLRTIPGLLRTLREGLAACSYDPRRLARSFKELQALHILALRGAPTAWLRPVEAVTEELVPSALVTPTELTGGLAVGGWIELRRVGATPRRVRLAGQTQSGVLLLVDRDGRQVLEIAAAELAAMIAKGGALVLGAPDETPLVDRALTAVARTLAQA